MPQIAVFWSERGAIGRLSANQMLSHLATNAGPFHRPEPAPSREHSPSSRPATSNAVAEVHEAGGRGPEFIRQGPLRLPQDRVCWPPMLFFGIAATALYWAGARHQISWTGRAEGGLFLATMFVVYPLIRRIASSCLRSISAQSTATTQPASH